MASILSVATSTLASAYLPIDDPSLRMAVSLGINEVVRSGTSYLPGIKKIKEYFQRGANRVAVFDVDHDNKRNPIYYRLEEYIISRYLEEIQKCDLVAEKGESETESR